MAARTLPGQAFQGLGKISLQGPPAQAHHRRLPQELVVLIHDEDLETHRMLLPPRQRLTFAGSPGLSKETPT
jgi:hypothetical protein